MNLREFSQDTLSLPWSKETAPVGLLAMLALPIALAAGVLSGHPAAGAIAAGSAFTVGFAVFYPVQKSPLLTMALVTAGIASATLAGSLCAKWTAAVLIVVAIGALNYGLLSGLGASANWIGQQSAVFLVVATYFPNGVHYAVGRATMVVAGGILQMVIYAVAHWRGRRPGQKTQDLHERLREYIRCLREEMAWTRETRGYVTRLVAVMVAGAGLYRGLDLRNGYWIPMTAIIVLKRQWVGTVSRSVARVIGTLSGAAIAYGLSHLHTFPQWLVGVLVMLAAFVCYSVQGVNYAIFSMALTLYIIFLFRFGGFSQTSAAHLRLLNTAIGGALALAVDGVWMLVERSFGSRAKELA